MTWDYTVLLLLDAALLVGATAVIVALVLRDLWRESVRRTRREE